MDLSRRRLIQLAAGAAALRVATAPAEVEAAVAPSSAYLQTRVVTGLGDSLTANGGGACPDSRNHVAHGVLASNGRAVYAPATATFGYTTQQIRDNLVTNALASNPAGIIVVLAGTNDIAQGMPLATTTANLLAIWQQILAAGAMPVACSIPPNNGYSTAKRIQLRALNLWIGSQASRLGIPFADYFSVLVDPATGFYRSGFTSDGTHTNGNSGARIGPVLAAAIADYLPGGQVPLIVDGSHGWQTGNQFDNPLFLRGSPTPDAVGVSTAGSPPNSYAMPPSADGPGNLLRITTGAQASQSLLRFFLSDRSAAAGDRVAFGFRVGWTPAAHAQFTLGLVNLTSYSNLGGLARWDVAIPAGSVWWQEVVMPATNMEPRLTIGNDGTAADSSRLELGQFTIQNLTATLPPLT